MSLSWNTIGRQGIFKKSKKVLALNRELIARMMLLSTGYDACFWKMSAFIVRTRGCHALHHILLSPSGLTRFMWAGMGLARAGRRWLSYSSTRSEPGSASVFVVCSLLALLLSPSVFLLRCVSPSMIDVSPQDLTHLSPAACLTAAQWAQHRPTCMNTQLHTT